MNKKLAEENHQLREIAKGQEARLAALEQQMEAAKREEALRNDALTALERDRGDMEDDYLPVLKQQQEMMQAQASEIHRLKAALNDFVAAHRSAETRGDEAGNGQRQYEAYLAQLHHAFGGEANVGVINRAMENHPWLDVVPAGMAQSRKQALFEAHQTRDARRVIALFTEFAKDTGIIQSNGAGQPVISPESVGSSPEGSSSSPQIPVAEYRAFADALAKGQIPREEIEQRKAYYDKAFREGRIVQ